MKHLVTIMSILIFLSVSCNTNPKGGNTKLQDSIDINNLLEQANNYYEMDDFSNALLIFNEILESDSTHGEVFYKRGYCWITFEDFAKANIDYQAAYSLDYEVEKTSLNLGITYYEIGKLYEALFYFTKAYELDTTNLNAKRFMENMEIILNLEKVNADSTDTGVK